MESAYRQSGSPFGLVGRVTEKIKRTLAYYPLSLYLGLIILVVAGFLLWAQLKLGWTFDWVQLKRWANNHFSEIVTVFSALLGLILISSAIAYKQVLDLPQEDYFMWLHQRATRTFFPIFTPLHDWIRLRSRVYRWWHMQTFSTTTHLIVLAASVIVLGNFAYSYIRPAQANVGCGDAVTITVDTTWATNQCHGDVVVKSGATLTINGGVRADMNSLFVGDPTGLSFGFITARGDTLNGLGVTLRTDTDLTVGSGSSISASSQGFTGGAISSTGNGTGAGTGSKNYGGGGGHGGTGGASSSGDAGGITYDSTLLPTQLGSGGGGGLDSAGGAGGGAIVMRVGGNLTISGTISAKGANSPSVAVPLQQGGGAGSGGSIWMVANVITGSGTISANGGDGQTAVNGFGQTVGSGCGGGGRISRHYLTDSFNGSLTTNKGGGICTTGSNGTIQTVGAVTQLSVSGLTTPRSPGVVGSVSVVALDVNSNQNYAYTKTITFTSSDSQATLPSNYAFTLDDAGAHSFSNGVTLNSVGTYSVTATQSDNGAVTGSQSGIVVNLGAFDHFALTAFPSSSTAGNAFSGTLTAKDAGNNTITTFTGTVTFSSSDSQATLPGSYTFTVASGAGSSGGTHTFSSGFNLKTAGNQTITATSSAGGNPTSVTVSVLPTSAASIQVSGIANPVSVGTAANVTVTAKDAYNNTATSFASPITFSSSDSKATLPGGYTFTVGDAGSHTFSGAVMFKTTGNQSVTATSSNPNVSASQSDITVNPGSVSSFTFTNLPKNSVKIGEQWTATVTARDAYGYTTGTSQSGGTLTAGLVGSLTTDFYTDSTYTQKTSSYRMSSGVATVYAIARQSGSLTLTASSTGASSISAAITVSNETVTPFEQPSTPLPPVAAPTGVGATIQNIANNITDVVKSSSGVTTGITIGSATLASGLLVTTPVVSSFSALILSNGPIMQVLLAGFAVRRRRGRGWGGVYDQLTNTPVPGVFVELIDAKANTVVKRMMTDQTGRYGFLPSVAGSYKVRVRSPLYQPYDGIAQEVTDPNLPLSFDIQLIPSEERLTRLKKVAKVISWVNVIDTVQLPILVLGTIFSIVLFFTRQNLTSIILLGVYAIALAFRFGTTHRQRGFGTIRDKSSNQPLDHVVVQLTKTTSVGEKTFVQSTITDQYGRFLLLAQPGNYIVTVAKEGYQLKTWPIHGSLGKLNLDLDPV